MLKFIAKRLGVSLLILFLGSILLFWLTIHSGDPLSKYRESNDPNAETIMRGITERLQLDSPGYERYWNWLTGVLKGDLGQSITGQSVNDLVAQAASSTLRLVVFATLLAITVGITLGIITAIRQYSGFDYGVTLFAFVCFSLPVFWLGVMLKYYFAIAFNDWIVEAKLGWPLIIGIPAVLAFVLQAALGGDLKRRLITFGSVTAGLALVLLYFDLVTWFRRPAVGIPVYILGVLGIALLVIKMTSGFHNVRVRNAVAVTGLTGIVGYIATRGTLMTAEGDVKLGGITLEVPFALLLGCFLAAIVVAVVAGQALGGFSRRQATFASVVTSILASGLAITDLLLSNWGAYLLEQPRPIPTIGSATPNYESTFWMHAIDGLTHILLPTITLVLISIAAYTRYTRASMLDVLNQDYIRTARSKGVLERKVITRHALRNSLIPLATIVAFDFAALIGGAVVTETVFGWQGMGNLFRTGLLNVDPAPVMGFFLVTGTAAVTMNMLADIAYAILDPRITR